MIEPFRENITDLPLLKNGKPHISYSEVSTWKACPWKHKLAYIEKLSVFETSPYLDYGTIIHEAAEGFIGGSPIDIDAVHTKIRAAWEKNGFDTPKFIAYQTARAKSQNWRYKHVPLQGWFDSAKNSLEQLPTFLDETFPGWKPVAAEHNLYENIGGASTGKFKGFIDCVLELPNGKHVVIDWKTAGPRGWGSDKKRDFLIQAQIVLYKHYWMQLTGKSSQQIKTAFVLLKRDSKPGKSMAIVEVSSGPKMLERANKMVSSMLNGMKSGLTIKNRLSCRFCEFKNTEHCT